MALPADASRGRLWLQTPARTGAGTAVAPSSSGGTKVSMPSLCLTVLASLEGIPVGLPPGGLGLSVGGGRTGGWLHAETSCTAGTPQEGGWREVLAVASPCRVQVACRDCFGVAGAEGSAGRNAGASAFSSALSPGADRPAVHRQGRGDSRRRCLHFFCIFYDNFNVFTEIRHSAGCFHVVSAGFFLKQCFFRGFALALN